MKKLLSFLAVVMLSFLISTPLSAQSTYDKKQGNISLPSYEKEKSSGTHSPTGLRGDHYSYWVKFKGEDIQRGNIYEKTDGSYYAVDLGSWYRYDTFENAVKAWYIHKKWGVIMEKGTNQR